MVGPLIERDKVQVSEGFMRGKGVEGMTEICLGGGVQWVQWVQVANINLVRILCTDLLNDRVWNARSFAGKKTPFVRVS